MSKQLKLCEQISFKSTPLFALLFTSDPARPLDQGATLASKVPLTLRGRACDQGITPADLPDFLVPSPRQVRFRHQPQSSAECHSFSFPIRLPHPCVPQFPQAESPGDGGSGTALLALKPPRGLGSRKHSAIDRVPGSPRPGPEPRHKVKTRTRTRGLRARSRAEAAREGRRQRTSGPGSKLLGAGGTQGPSPEASPGGTRRDGAPEHSPAPLRSPAASCPGPAPLRVFLRPHFRRSAPSHCARLEAGGAPAPRSAAGRKRAPEARAAQVPPSGGRARRVRSEALGCWLLVGSDAEHFQTTGGPPVVSGETEPNCCCLFIIPSDSRFQ